MNSFSDRDLHVISSLITAGVIGLMVFVVTTAGTGIAAGDEHRTSLADAEHIEAALAFKKPDPKKRQPQKRKKQKFKKPDAPTVSRDEKAEPKPKEKDKPPVKPDEFDPMAILEKNRKLQEEDNLSDTGAEVAPDEGAIFGDEWGSGDKNKGDPYVGGLKARIDRTFEAKAPGFIGAGKTVWGCVKLDKSGKVADWEVPDEGRSDLPVLNSAMEETLKNIPAMDKAVPDKLLKLLTEMGVCFRLTTK